MANENRLGSASFRSFIAELNSLNSNLDLNLINGRSDTSCKYYECQEFNTLISTSKFNFSAFHLNISSHLAKHFDEFNALLGLCVRACVRSS